MLDLSSLNKGQSDAVQTTQGPVLIIAGAGTGKTHTLMTRVAYLIDNGVPSISILLMTFTNKAANEMKERAMKLVGPSCSGITACTYHSFCSLMLRQYGHMIGLNNDFTIVTPSDARDIIKFVKADNANDYKVKGFPPVTTLASIYSAHINREKTIHDLLMEPNWDKYAMHEILITNLYNDFVEYKSDHNYLDYDDMLVKFYELLQVPSVLDAIGKLYRYIMIDEYQDTNNVQEKIVRKLSSVCSNVAVVGDDYQSIYAFRGSNIENFIDFPANHAGCKTVFLTENYRSVQPILDLSNAVMANNANFGYKKTMTSSKVSSLKPKVIHLKDDEQESKYLVKNIKDIIAGNNLPLSEVAIIYRNTVSAAKLEIELRKNGIPYDKRGGAKFFDRECIQDMIAYMRCVVNPTDTIGWFRILQLYPNIKEIRGKAISESCGTEVMPNLDFLLTTEYSRMKTKTDCEIHGDLTVLNDLICQLKAESSFGNQCEIIAEYYLNLRQRAIDESKRLNEETKIDMQEKLDDDKGCVDILLELTKNYQSIIEFLDDIVLDGMPDVAGTVNGELVLTTIHSAKGLEWDTVFLMDCMDGVFPNTQSKIFLDDTYKTYAEESINEELRCFYVAITRAKNRLEILYPHRLQVYGKTLNNNLTRYMDDCGSYYDADMSWLMRK